MALLFVAALIGGASTVAVLWPYGAVLALASAPFGGSCLALLAGLLLALRRKKAARKQEPQFEAPHQEPRMAA